MKQEKEFEMRLAAKPFEKIKNGSKTIELRLYDEKRQKISTNDIIVFTNTSTKERIKTRVVRLHIYESFKELYEKLPLEKCGYTKDNIRSDSYKDMLEYYPKEMQSEYKVVGIELERI